MFWFANVDITYIDSNQIYRTLWGYSQWISHRFHHTLHYIQLVVLYQLNIPMEYDVFSPYKYQRSGTLQIGFGVFFRFKSSSNAIIPVCWDPKGYKMSFCWIYYPYSAELLHLNNANTPSCWNFNLKIASIDNESV